VEPRWRDVERRVTRSLVSPEDRARGVRVLFDTSEVRALFDDDKLKAEVATSLRDEWTRDERRAYTGQEPIGGEEGAQIGSAVAASPFGEMASDRSLEFKGRSEKAIQWLIFDGSCKASERSWEREVAKGLSDWKSAIRRLGEKHLRDAKEIRPTSGEKFVDAVGDWLKKTGIPLMRTLVYPLVFSTAEKAVKQVAGKVGLAFDVFEPGVLEYAEREAEFLAGVMGSTTGQKVAETVQKGLAEGDLVRDLTKRLEDSAAFSRSRAKLVARTETTRAWNGAQRSGMSRYQKAAGKVVMKTWLSAQDDRVRDEHMDLDGMQIPVDDEFPNGLTEPGEPNCRCTLTYAISDLLED